MSNSLLESEIDKYLRWYLVLSTKVTVVYIPHNHVRMPFCVLCAMPFPLSIFLSLKQLFMGKPILPAKEQLFTNLCGALWNTNVTLIRPRCLCIESTHLAHEKRFLHRGPYVLKQNASSDFCKQAVMEENHSKPRDVVMKAICKCKLQEWLGFTDRSKQ